MDSLVRIRKPKSNPYPFCAYWIESSAPLNVDDPQESAAQGTRAQASVRAFDDATEEILDPDQALDEIADYLNGAKSPEIVISIHGFNNPEEVVKDRYMRSYKYLSGDDCLRDRAGLVCIGYRWPSEKLGRPWPSLLAAAPRGLVWTFGFALALLGGGLLTSAPPARRLPNRSLLHGLLYALGGLLVTLPLTAFLMRVAVYFRDAYRAVNYGVPDLLEVIRHLDRTVTKRHTPQSVRPKATRIKLSFIGHSMGAFVVTNLVRILSDVFSPAGMTPSLKGSALPSAAPTVTETAQATQAVEEIVPTVEGTVPNGHPLEDAPAPEVIHHIGRAYTLERLVLVSPDIPAEALLQGRANFLQSSLGRFREAHLFSNEGDEALRLISTVGNYFSFPTKDRMFGYRLGNVNIVKPPRGKPEYGIINLDRLGTCHPDEAERFLKILNAGKVSLAVLINKLSPHGLVQPMEGAASPLPAKFTYFDCTDYTDAVPQPDGTVRTQPVMTLGKGKTSLNDWDHFRLLLGYLFQGTPDVHSGYFSGPLTQCLIYRLSCLGVEETFHTAPPASVSADSPTVGLDGWSALCKKHKLQVLLSPIHYQWFAPPKGETP